MKAFQQPSEETRYDRAFVSRPQVTALRPDNVAMRGELTRGKLIVTFAVGAVAFGAAAWLLLGPVWTVAGVLVGPLIAVVVVAVVHVFTAPDAASLLSDDKPDEAMALLRNEMASWRTLARIWPSQFRDALASRLIVQSGALQALNRDEEALRTADEAVAIYQPQQRSRRVRRENWAQFELRDPQTEAAALFPVIVDMIASTVEFLTDSSAMRHGEVNPCSNTIGSRYLWKRTARATTESPLPHSAVAHAVLAKWVRAAF